MGARGRPGAAILLTPRTCAAAVPPDLTDHPPRPAQSHVFMASWSPPPAPEVIWSEPSPLSSDGPSHVCSHALKSPPGPSTPASRAWLPSSPLGPAPQGSVLSQGDPHRAAQRLSGACPGQARWPPPTGPSLGPAGGGFLPHRKGDQNQAPDLPQVLLSSSLFHSPKQAWKSTHTSAFQSYLPRICMSHCIYDSV